MKVDAEMGFDRRGIGATAKQSESAGYDGLWALEAGHDPFLQLAIAAEVTERIDLATGIAVAFARNPMSLAVLANDIHLLSDGRCILGLGSQIKAHITRRYSMPWSHPAPRMREMILAIRAIWACWNTGAALDFRGEYYTHTLMTPFFNPGPNPYGEPTILLAGVGSLMSEVAGEVADGLLAHGFTTERYLREVSLPALERGAAKAGKTRADLVVACPGMVVTGSTDEEMETAAAAVKNQLAFYGSTPAYKPVLDLHGWGDLHAELNQRSKGGDWASMGRLITDEMLETFAVVCPLDQLAEKVADRYGGLLDRFSFYAPYHVDSATWRGVVEDLKARTA